MKSADDGGMDALLVLAELHLFGLKGTRARRRYPASASTPISRTFVVVFRGDDTK